MSIRPFARVCALLSGRDNVKLSAESPSKFHWLFAKRIAYFLSDSAFGSPDLDTAQDFRMRVLLPIRNLLEGRLRWTRSKLVSAGNNLNADNAAIEHFVDLDHYYLEDTLNGESMSKAIENCENLNLLVSMLEGEALDKNEEEVDFEADKVFARDDGVEVSARTRGFDSPERTSQEAQDPLMLLSEDVLHKDICLARQAFQNMILIASSPENWNEDVWKKAISLFATLFEKYLLTHDTLRKWFC